MCLRDVSCVSHRLSPSKVLFSTLNFCLCILISRDFICFTFNSLSFQKQKLKKKYKLKSRDIILPTKVRLVKAVVFPVVMYGGESWTIKKAEH